MIDRPILVPLDGSELSERALPYAVSIAGATSRSLSLLTVWEGVERELRSAPSTTVREIDLRGRACREIYLDAVTRRVAAQGLEVVGEIRDGDPAEELLWYCDEHAPGLLVMATHGRSGIRRMWYGSVASKLMRAAFVPTLLAGPRVLEKDKELPGIREILVPLDGSPVSELALRPAAMLAEAFQARLVLARAMRWPALTFAPDVHDPALPEVDRELMAEAEGYLSRILEKTKLTQAPETLVLRGHPAEAILEFVAQRRIDLVVMASHARSGVIRWTLGSVADRVIQGAAPVLLIRPEVATMLMRSEQLRGRYCHNCGRAVAYVEVAQDDRCLRCGRHLHVCANCVHFVGLTCLLQRPEAHDTYPGLNCPQFQFRESIPAKGRAAAAALGR